MRYVQTSAPQHRHQHPPQQATMVMTAVRTPDGGMGWIPAHMLGQPSPQQQMAMAQMQAMQQQGMQPQTMMMPQQAPTVVVQSGPASSSALKTLLVVGGVGLVGYWAYKKWGRGLMSKGRELVEEILPGEAENSEDLEAGERRHVRTRRRHRSRSRMMSEFKNFLDSGAHELEEVREDAGECLGCADADVDDYEPVEGGVNY